MRSLGPLETLLLATSLAIAIDVGERKRLSAPATMRWENGRVVEAKAGYVVELKLVSRFIRWDPDVRVFRYEERAAPEELAD